LLGRWGITLLTAAATATVLLVGGYLLFGGSKDDNGAQAAASNPIGAANIAVTIPPTRPANTSTIIAHPTH